MFSVGNRKLFTGNNIRLISFANSLLELCLTFASSKPHTKGVGDGVGVGVGGGNGDGAGAGT